MKFALLVVFIVFTITATSQNEIVGKWKIQSGKAIVQIYEQNGKYYGKITWLAEPNDAKGKPKTDSKNPNAKLRKKRLLGLVVLSGFVYKAKEYKDGMLYNPETGDVYNCKMWLKDKNTLMGRGYLGVVYKTQTWTRVE